MFKLAPVAVAIYCFCLGQAGPAIANPGSSSIQAAKALSDATVTLRIAVPTSNAGDVALDPNPSAVSVVSGVSVGEGLVVTFAALTPASQIRATLPDGGQASAQTRVVDEYSGLALLELDRPGSQGLEIAKSLPAIGTTVFTAAASGIQPPLISQGILGGVDRSIRGRGLPPLLQCDLRTAETSAGAGVTDTESRLLGIIAATGDGHGGWTYAIPAEYVTRLIEARREGKSVLLRRLRPSLGLILGPGDREGTVRVDRVAPGGPADQAGVRQNDLILSADGRQIRNAYQAIGLVLKKQPGDQVEFVIEQDGKPKTVQVTLGDAGKLPELEVARGGSVRIGSQVQAQNANPAEIKVHSGAHTAQLSIEGQGKEGRSNSDEVLLLRNQLQAFDKVISRLQEELKLRDESQRQTNELIKSLTAEVAKLREQLNDAN